MYYLSTGTKFMAKFMSGFLLKDILDRFSSKIQNSLSPNRKLWMYSSHDSTVFSFLHSLDISDVRIDIISKKKNHFQPNSFLEQLRSLCGSYNCRIEKTSK